MSFAQLKQIWNIMCLRSGPQVLPFSYRLLALLLVAHTLIDIVLAGREALSWPTLAGALVNTLFTAGFVFVLLQWAKKMERFVQTLAAVLGTEVLIGMIGAVLLLVYQIPAFSGVVGLLWLGLIVWTVVVAGHIFHHSLDTSMLWGVALAVLYIIIAYNVVTAVAVADGGV